MIQNWFLAMLSIFLHVHIWAEVEAWRCGYPEDPSSGEYGNEVFMRFVENGL